MSQHSGAAVARFLPWFLVAEALGATCWWGSLLFRPESRPAFQAPDGWTALLAFLPADLLFIGTAMAGALGFRNRAQWAAPVLWIHAGSAAYAALYCLGLMFTSGGRVWWAAAAMFPVLLTPALLVLAMRPAGKP
jgi:hypothetical protein